MFTGIIEGLGTLQSVRTSGQSRQLTVMADFDLDGSRVGDSIAVNGACLTATSIAGRVFAVDVSPETVSRTTLGQATAGARVNLERALRLSDRLDGHLVSGHVDGLATLAHRQTLANAIVLKFAVSRQLSRYMIQKGSVAVDGVSLTINHCDDSSFEVSIIPHTAQLTTVGKIAVGGRVNIETDLIGKYVERFLQKGRTPDERSDDDLSGVSMNLLARTGFI